uniref:Far upstream element-binding protein 1 n=1 Tax=Aceria tosichella TaxID=561515 RepID=A0A6G1S893_9ACAR
MADQAALQEAIQRARQLAAKITQNQPPVKRPAPSSNELSGPVKVTLAYEKPANSDDKNRHNTEHSSRRRSSSRDHNRNVRDYSHSRESRGDSRDRRDYRDSSHSRESREPTRNNHSSGTSSANENNNLSSSSSHENNQYESSAQQQQQQPPPPPPASRSSEEKIEIIIPHAVIGLVIGKGGENIKRIQNESGATVRVDPNTVDERGNKLCTITGTKMAVEEARLQVENVIENAATIKRPRMQPVESSADSFRMKIPASRTGAIIGKGGETIKSIKQQSGCDIELDKGAKECGPEESVFIIRGSQDKIMKARSLIEARLAVGNRDRDGRGGGGGGGMRDHRDDHHSGRGKGGVATGANAAPVGQYPDLPAAAYPAASGQQNSADMTAAWAAYFAQYSTLFNQTGAQPSTPGMPYPGQPSLLSSTAPVSAPAAAPTTVSSQSVPQMDPQQPQQQPSADSGASGGQDYSDQWIEFYIANGRPDYAEQIIQMKKQQQQQAHK